MVVFVLTVHLARFPDRKDKQIDGHQMKVASLPPESVFFGILYQQNAYACLGLIIKCKNILGSALLGSVVKRSPSMGFFFHKSPTSVQLQALFVNISQSSHAV